MNLEWVFQGFNRRWKEVLRDHSQFIQFRRGDSTFKQSQQNVIFDIILSTDMNYSILKFKNYFNITMASVLVTLGVQLEMNI